MLFTVQVFRTFSETPKFFKKTLHNIRVISENVRTLWNSLCFPRIFINSLILRVHAVIFPGVLKLQGTLGRIQKSCANFAGKILISGPRWQATWMVLVDYIAAFNTPLQFKGPKLRDVEGCF